ncbi:MAG: TIM-barrel domain-containing protein [Pontibacterium sp.]
MKPIKYWSLASVEDNRVILECDQQHELVIFVLDHQQVRVLLKKNRSLRMSRTWCVAPNDTATPFSGRDRLDTEGFNCPAFELEQYGQSIRLVTSELRLTIEQPLRLVWERKSGGDWVVFAEDRKTDPYMVGARAHDIWHFMTRDIADKYYGLGEKTGDLNRHGRRFEMRNIDAMGYNAETTDPLYKHIPFYIAKTPNASFSLYYDNLATSWFDLGNELDNYHGYYRAYRAEDGDLDYYVTLGSSVLELTKAQVALTGRTYFGPKWSLGYSGSTMHYTDAENAQEQLEGFVGLCAKHEMPCDSFQLSSGYTSIGDKRYVFNWNNSKVPDPEGMSAHFHSHGVRLAANIKPCLLQDHPMYKDVAEQGMFILDSEHSEPERSIFWDDEGSHLDFTNPKTVQWWKANVTSKLLEKGIDSTWNDNNEYEIWDREARCYGFGESLPISLIRPLQPLLMMRASYEAQIEFSRSKRAYLISRSGCPGMQRYVQTWSGDNRTNWSTLRYNTRMGVGMSLSGLYNIGHDVGGFSGDKPDMELFVRWVQNGVMHPRFTIHSWNDDQTVNEPWMFPEATPFIREAMALRYRLLPYFYDLLWKAHADHEPMLRSTFLDHEEDEQTYLESDDFLLGKDLLVASVVEPEHSERDVYLPENKAGWFDFYTGDWYAGGQHISLPAPLSRLPLLARAGSVIPVSDRVAHVDSQKDDTRGLLVFPLQGEGVSRSEIFDDDGETFNFIHGQHLTLTIVVSTSSDCIELSISKSGDWIPAYRAIKIMLPSGESRFLKVNGKVFNCGEAVELASL